jgi:hypothetical protein
MEIIELNNLILKKWQDAIAKSKYEIAINLDLFHYINIVKKNENTEYWDKWQNETFADRLSIVKKIDEIYPLRKIKNKNQKKLIVMPNYSGLAHEIQISRNLNFYKKIEFFEFEVVYLNGKKKGDEILASKLYNIPVSKIHFLMSNNYEDAGRKLQKLTYEQNYNSIIYISVFQIAFWMSIFINHPNQKFIVMKYYPKQVGRFTAWAGGKRTSHEFYTKNNDIFLQLPILNLNHTQDEGFQKYFYDKNKEVLNFGSISRIDKINNIEYLKFISFSLNKFENLKYLYTGKLNEEFGLMPSIKNKNRIINLGWVNPLEAINKFDIYLEPFPWGGGEMTLLALQVGLPYLTLNTKENTNIGLYSFLKNISMNECEELKYSFCDDYNELTTKIQFFIENPEYRFLNGKAWREFIRLYKPKNIEHWSKFLMC